MMFQRDKQSKCSQWAKTYQGMFENNVGDKAVKDSITLTRKQYLVIPSNHIKLLLSC